MSVNAQKRTAPHKCIMFPHRPGTIGGPSSFQSRFEAILREKGWSVKYADEGGDPDVVFVVGGTRRLLWLLRMKARGVRIILRLDGLYWQFWNQDVPLRHKVLWYIHNYYAAFLRKFVANVIVYQSNFVAHLWDEWFGRVSKPQYRIYNAVDTAIFTTMTKQTTGSDIVRLICVEGEIAGSTTHYILSSLSEYRLEMYGHIRDSDILALAGDRSSNVRIMGVVARTEIPSIYWGRCVYVSLDLLAACPNTVIEAMACGVPVVGFDTGSLRELVGEGGVTVPYGGNPWRGDLPNTRALLIGIDEVLRDYERYARLARQRAVDCFDINRMAESYLQLLQR